MVCTRINPTYSQKHEHTGTSILSVSIYAILYYAHSSLRNWPNILIKKWERVLSRILQETIEKAGFIYSSWKLAKVWSILHRSMISLKSSTKILWWVCRSSWSYFHSILNFTVRQHLQVAKRKKVKKNIVFHWGLTTIWKILIILYYLHQNKLDIWHSN